MRVTFAHLCDHALIAADQKMSIIGIFSQIKMAALPGRHPQMFVAFEVEVNYAEVGKAFEIRLEMVDPDGNQLFQTKAEAKVDGERKPGNNPHFGQVLNIQGLEFKRAGTHNINIFLDGHFQSHAQLRVDVLKAPQASQGA